MLAKGATAASVRFALADMLPLTICGGPAAAGMGANGAVTSTDASAFDQKPDAQAQPQAHGQATAAAAAADPMTAVQAGAPDAGGAETEPVAAADAVMAATDEAAAAAANGAAAPPGSAQPSTSQAQDSKQTHVDEAAAKLASELHAKQESERDASVAAANESQRERLGKLMHDVEAGAHLTPVLHHLVLSAAFTCVFACSELPACVCS